MTHRYLTLPTLALTLVACTPMDRDATDGWPAAPMLNPGDYAMQDLAQLDLTGAEMLPEAATAVQARLSSREPAEGNYTETLNSYSKDGRGAVVLTQDGLADDSVRAMQHVIEFTLRPDPQVEGRVLAMPEGYGTRQKCYRAADPEAWTNQPCP